MCLRVACAAALRGPARARIIIIILHRTLKIGDDPRLGAKSALRWPTARLLTPSAWALTMGVKRRLQLTKQLCVTRFLLDACLAVLNGVPAD